MDQRSLLRVRLLAVASCLFLVSSLPVFYSALENDATSWGHLAEIANQAGLPEEAIADYAKAVEESPAAVSPSARIAGAQAFEKLHQFERAQQAYAEALEVWPNDSRVLNAYGVHELRLGKLDAGVSLLKQSIEADPGFIDPYKNLYIALSRHQKPIEAEPFKAAALALDPNDTEFIQRANR